jgi:exopolysaccharide biosynthesis polyprenyl glycosylphosphotransferase
MASPDVMRPDPSHTAGMTSVGLPTAHEVPPSPTIAARTASVARARRDTVYRRTVAVADAMAATVALLISIVIVGAHENLAVLITIPLIVVLSKLFGNYDREDLLVRKSTLDEAPALFQLATLYALAVWLIDGLLISGGRARSELLILWVSLFALLLLFRAAARSLSRRLTPPERCLVIGDPATCEWMQTKFERRPALHAAIVAAVSPPPGAEDDPVTLTGTDLQELTSRFDIDRVVITPGSADNAGVVDLVHAATSVGLKVSVLPRVLEVVGTSVEFDDVEGIPLLSMRPLGLPRQSRVIKRGLDIVGSTLAVVLLAPVMAVIALAILIDSGRPVLFRQRRVGRDGKGFDMVKFRTMIDGAEEQKEDLRHLNEAVGLFKIDSDPRVTRVGRFLRRTSLDELPQLFNVQKGEMSLVGPRPLILEEDQLIEGWRRRRLHLTPGMTGHWQILGSARIPLEEMMRIDYLYVTNWSLWLDVKILLRTLPYVLARKGM